MSLWDERTQVGEWLPLPERATYPVAERRCGGEFHCPEDFEGRRYECFHAGRAPEWGVTKQNKDQGITGFDNVGQAMLTIFVFVTMQVHSSVLPPRRGSLLLRA